jgi:hypothetical protein
MASRKRSRSAEPAVPIRATRMAATLPEIKEGALDHSKKQKKFAEKLLEQTQKDRADALLILDQKIQEARAFAWESQFPLLEARDKKKIDTMRAYAQDKKCSILVHLSKMLESGPSYEVRLYCDSILATEHTSVRYNFRSTNVIEDRSDNADGWEAVEHDDIVYSEEPESDRVDSAKFFVPFYADGEKIEAEDAGDIEEDGLVGCKTMRFAGYRWVDAEILSLKKTEVASA